MLIPLWTQRLPFPVRGLALARETDALLAWDEGNSLTLLNHAGQRQAQVRLAAQIIQAVCADDGTTAAVLTADGLCWLGLDLNVQRTVPLTERPIAFALDSFGQYAVVSDARNRLTVFDRTGAQRSQFPVPRAFHHVAFVPSHPLIVGCADYGLAGCYRFDGQVVWQQGLVAHTGGLVVAGPGSPVQIACFSEGIQRFDLKGSDLGRIKVADSCRLLAASFTGETVLVAGLSDSIARIDSSGRETCRQRTDDAVTALAVGALGEYGCFADGAGRIVKASMSP